MKVESTKDVVVTLTLTGPEALELYNFLNDVLFVAESKLTPHNVKVAAKFVNAIGNVDLR